MFTNGGKAIIIGKIPAILWTEILLTPQNELTHAKNDESGVGRLPMESNQIL